MQYRQNRNACHSNAPFDNGSEFIPDYTGALSGGRETWQRVWETEVGTTIQGVFETVEMNKRTVPVFTLLVGKVVRYSRKLLQ